MSSERIRSAGLIISISAISLSSGTLNFHSVRYTHRQGRRANHDTASTAVIIDDVAQLRHQVHQILTILSADEARSPAAWFWLTMTDQERRDKHSELLDWVESVLRKQYPDYLADRIRPCWPNHPEARWELACLYQLWSAAYLADRPTARDAADWHDRWSPGAIHRLTRVMSQCEGKCIRQPSTKTAGDPQRRSLR